MRIKYLRKRREDSAHALSSFFMPYSTQKLISSGFNLSAAITPVGMSLVTVLPAPMIEPSPMVTPPQTVTLALIQTQSSILFCLVL